MYTRTHTHTYTQTHIRTNAYTHVHLRTRGVGIVDPKRSNKLNRGVEGVVVENPFPHQRGQDFCIGQPASFDNNDNSNNINNNNYPF